MFRIRQRWSVEKNLIALWESQLCYELVLYFCRKTPDAVEQYLISHVVSPPRIHRGELEGASEIPDNVHIQSGTISSNEFASLYSKAKKMELIVATKTEEQAIADAER